MKAEEWKVGLFAAFILQPSSFILWPAPSPLTSPGVPGEGVCNCHRDRGDHSKSRDPSGAEPRRDDTRGAGHPAAYPNRAPHP